MAFSDTTLSNRRRVIFVLCVEPFLASSFKIAEDILGDLETCSERLSHHSRKAHHIHYWNRENIPVSMKLAFKSDLIVHQISGKQVLAFGYGTGTTGAFGSLALKVNSLVGGN